MTQLFLKSSARIVLFIALALLPFMTFLIAPDVSAQTCDCQTSYSDGLTVTSCNRTDFCTEQCAEGATCSCVGACDEEGGDPCNVGKGKLANPLCTNSLQVIIGRVIKIFTGVAGTVALLMFIWGGVLMLTSAGNAERVSQGKKSLVWAVLGLLFIFSSYAILATLFKSLGLNL